MLVELTDRVINIDFNNVTEIKSSLARGEKFGFDYSIIIKYKDKPFKEFRYSNSAVRDENYRRIINKFRLCNRDVLDRLSRIERMLNI